MMIVIHKLRAAVAQFDFEQAREYEALREEATVLKIAGILVDAGNIDEFERVCRRNGDGDNALICAGIAKTRRWIANRDRRREDDDSAASDYHPMLPSRAALPFHEIGAPSCADAADASLTPRCCASAVTFPMEAS